MPPAYEHQMSLPDLNNPNLYKDGRANKCCFFRWLLTKTFILAAFGIFTKEISRTTELSHMEEPDSKEE
jgi:hypothetical protein